MRACLDCKLWGKVISPLFSSTPIAISCSSSCSDTLSFNANHYLTFYELLLSLSLILRDSLSVLPIFFFCCNEDEEDWTFESELPFFIDCWYWTRYDKLDKLDGPDPALLSTLSISIRGPGYCLNSSYLCCKRRFSFSFTCSRMVPICPGRLCCCAGLLDDCVLTTSSLGPE